MQLVLNTYGLSLKRKKGAFWVSNGQENRHIAPALVESIAILSPCLISSSAIELAAESGIPIYFFGTRGEVVASLRSPYFESIATLRRRQVYFSDQSAGADWVLDQFRIKTFFQIVLLEKLAKRRRKLAAQLIDLTNAINVSVEKMPLTEQAPNADWANRVMGWEGAVAKKYWTALALVLEGPWSFAGRSRRPAEDPFNATINYLYAFLYSLVEQALFHAGLDPHLGILHADEYDRPTLAYDLIEPFRPWVDELVVMHLLSAKVKPEAYEAFAEGITLNNSGKQFWIPAFNEWMEKPIRWEKRQMTRKAHIFRKADELAKLIRTSVKRPV